MDLVDIVLEESGYYEMWHNENSDEADFFPNSNGFFRNGVEVFNDDDANMNWQRPFQCEGLDSVA